MTAKLESGRSEAGLKLPTIADGGGLISSASVQSARVDDGAHWAVDIRKRLENINII